MDRYEDHVVAGWHDGFLHRYTIAPLPRHHRHAHTELEWNLVVAGTGRYQLAGRRYDLAPGMLVWLLPGEQHVLTDTRPGLTLWAVALRGAALRRHLGATVYAPLHAVRPRQRMTRILPPEQAQRLADLLHEVAQAAGGERARFNHGIVYATALAWDWFLEADETLREAHPAVAAATALLRADPALPLAEVARRAGLSPGRLTQRIRSACGCPLVTWRMRVRVDEALRRARLGQDLAGAAQAAGFGSYRQFHRACRQVHGVGPRAARNPAARTGA